ncbi:MAG: methionine synthase [Candidatus Heimdallarchaeota archaeon]|nr:MAG: methionine synthase [Candidatus Heimdallarchaeota archaeon]
MKQRKILCATLGSCVHIAGIFNFIQLAQQLGYETVFLRPPNTVDEILQAIAANNPSIIALSYRLTPEAAVEIVKELERKITAEMKEKKWIFGGTTPVCKAIEPFELFDSYFDGMATEVDVLGFLRSSNQQKTTENVFPQTLVERIEFMHPFPVLRAHFGLPTVEKTRNGITRIARARLIDIISIGPDQNFQESFFRPQDMKQSEVGAGGVPIRSEEDLSSFYEASKCGNYPLLRCYSGTRDLVKMTELLHRTISNAWGATPLFWYSELDGRSPRTVLEAIIENQANMKWHGVRNIPFEANEAHHWSLRSASDAIAVTAAYLGAYNAKYAGVKRYVSQLMFDTPLGISPRFDIAKMLAKTEMIEKLHDDSFKSFRQVRTGLLSFPEDPYLAKGQLASSIQIAMFLKPHIVHVVSYCEADHAATPDDIIESAKITRKVVANSARGLPRISLDHKLEEYKQQLITDTYTILQAINHIADEGVRDPCIHPPTLVKAIKMGIFDAPHLKGLSAARGDIYTSIINGKCLSVDKNTGNPIQEKDRVNEILEREGFLLIEQLLSNGIPIT